MKAYINGRIFDGKKILENTIVLVENEKIIAVSEKENLIKEAGFNFVSIWEYDWNKLIKTGSV